MMLHAASSVEGISVHSYHHQRIATVSAGRMRHEANSDVTVLHTDAVEPVLYIMQRLSE
jgi:hypothetical protein